MLKKYFFNGKNSSSRKNKPLKRIKIKITKLNIMQTSKNGFNRKVLKNNALYDLILNT
jgi:hypothetical protein